MLKDIKVSNTSWMNYGDDSVVKNTHISVKFMDLSNISDLKLMESRDGDSQYTIKTNDRLDLIAKEFYDSEFLWWVIAYRNNIIFAPVQLNEGDILIIPDPIYVKNEIEL